MADTPDVNPAALERLKSIGGVRLLVNMIELFVQHAPARVAAASQAARAADLDALSGAVHSLKSSAGNLGACAVQDLAERLERAATEGRAAEIPALIEDLERALPRALARLEEEKRRSRE
jgi:HPt (histidine-containing phosphotransfer) domain-containing protein